MSSKLLTVIVPSYNMENYLRACLDSVLAGNPMADRLDVIVVNDGSTDGTSAIAHEVAAAHPGSVRVIDKTNGNYGSCINAALPEAAGRYVKILDADDTFDGLALSRYLQFLADETNEAGPDVVFNEFVSVRPDGSEVRRSSLAFTGARSFLLSDFDFTSGRELWMHAIAYRTSLVRNIGYRQTEGVSYSDQEWSTIPMMSATSFRHCPECVYRYTVGRAGQTVDRAVFVRNFPMHFVIARRIVREYCLRRESSDNAHLVFLENQIKYHLRLFYYEVLLRDPRQTHQDELRKFDDFLASVDEGLFRYPGTFKCIRVMGKVRFPFVLEWRKGRVRNTMPFRLFRVYLRAKATVRAFGAKRKRYGAY